MKVIERLNRIYRKKFGARMLSYSEYVSRYPKDDITEEEYARICKMWKGASKENRIYLKCYKEFRDVFARRIHTGEYYS